jgi:hypothetical protein
MIEEKISYVIDELKGRRQNELNALTRLQGPLSAMTADGFGVHSPNSVEIALSASTKQAVYASYLEMFEKGPQQSETPEHLYRRLERHAIDGLARSAANGLTQSTSWARNEQLRCQVAALGTVVGLFIDMMDPV